MLDPSQISRRPRLDPLRCYLSLRRALEPHWYRSFWKSDPWSRFLDSATPVTIECSENERARLALLDEIPSAVTHEQAVVLYWLARTCAAEGDIVEIGSDMGKSTIALSWGAAKSERQGTVRAVDPFFEGASLTAAERLAAFENNLSRFEAKNVKLARMLSGDYRRQTQAPVRLLFVDAAHDYLNSSYDFLAWRELISPGGFLAAHDVDNYSHGPGTRKAFLDCVLMDSRFQLVYHKDNLAVAQSKST